MKILMLKLMAVPLLFTCMTIHAQTVTTTHEINTNPQNSAVSNTLVGNAQDWELTADEWGRYQQLMQGPSAKWYPNLSPASILGLNAKTAQEQQHFAEVVAKEEHDKLAREISFNNAVHESLLKLYSDEPVVKSFNTSPYNPVQFSDAFNKKSNTSINLQSGDHMALFIDANIGDGNSILSQLMMDIKNTPGTVLDIFCVGKISDDQIQAWAKSNNIPPDLVVHGRITLNHDKGKLQKVTGSHATLPYLLLVRNGESKPVSAWGLS